MTETFRSPIFLPFEVLVLAAISTGSALIFANADETATSHSHCGQQILTTVLNPMSHAAWDIEKSTTASRVFVRCEPILPKLNHEL